MVLFSSHVANVLILLLMNACEGVAGATDINRFSMFDNTPLQHYLL